MFLLEASRDWGNVCVASTRAEDCKGAFDWTVLRAVAAGPILGDLARLAPKTAILCGERTAEEVSGEPEFEWSSPIALPWGERRYLLCGRRST